MGRVRFAGRGGRSGARTATRRAGGFSVVGDDDCGKMARPEVCGSTTRRAACLSGADASKTGAAVTF
jgi:hypothetical protein